MNRLVAPIAFAMAALMIASCDGSASLAPDPPTPTPAIASPDRDTVTTAAGTSPTPSSTRAAPDTDAPPTTAAASSAEPEIDRDRGGELDTLVRQATASWPTDWESNSIDLGELRLGLQMLDPRDGIPPIDDPAFEPARAASEWLDDRVPGVMVQVGGETRFYPLGILHRHEIVNDEIAGVPVAVTYCPLCNTALAFDRRVDGRVLRLGVSGLLRNSDLVMWDDATVSLWQQVTGEAIVGSYTGTVLAPLPTAIVAFGEFAASYPDALTLSGRRGFPASYNSNPYVGYSTRSAPYPFYTGEIDPRYPALERIVGVTEGGAATAYPFPVISGVGAVNDSVGGVPVAVFWGGDTADALDTANVSEGRSVGTGIAYLRTLDGRELTFTKEADLFRDEQTSSEWTILGEAINGPLAGSRLHVAVHRNEFWFVWGAFYPEGRVYKE